MRPGAIFFILAISFFATAFSQSSNYWGTYHSVSIKKEITKDWSVFADNELRGIRVFHRYFYYEIKTGANFKLSKKLTASVAAGVYKTFKEGEKYEFHLQETQWKIWQQMQYAQSIGAINVQHRIRLEEDLSNKMKMQLRYRPQAELPLNKKEMKEGAFYATAFNELFFGFDMPVFIRNRFFGGFGYVFSNKATLQLGMIRQVDFKDGSADRRKNFIYTNIGLSF